MHPGWSQLLTSEAGARYKAQAPGAPWNVPYCHQLQQETPRVWRASPWLPVILGNFWEGLNFILKYSRPAQSGVGGARLSGWWREHT